MKKVIGFCLLVLVTASVQGDERLFKRLERKFDRNPEKGLEYAKKLKSKKSVEPDGYYFLANNYFQKLNDESKILRKYSALNRASSEAYRMKKYAVDHPYLKSYQEALINQLAVLLQAQRDTFLLYKDYDKSERLAKHYNRLTGKKLLTLEQLDSIEDEKQKQAKLLLQVSRVIDGKYYGMPTGDEDISSHSFEKEKEVIALINAERIKKGLVPLKWSFDLTRAARYHANDMATQGYFNHNSYDRIDGELVEIGGTFKRIRKFYDLRFVNSENIAAGSETAANTYSQWFTSKGHYDNMFNESSRYVGLGVAYDATSPYKYYWVFCSAR